MESGGWLLCKVWMEEEVEEGGSMAQVKMAIET